MYIAVRQLVDIPYKKDDKEMTEFLKKFDVNPDCTDGIVVHSVVGGFIFNHETVNEASPSNMQAIEKEIKNAIRESASLYGEQFFSDKKFQQNILKQGVGEMEIKRVSIDSIVAISNKGKVEQITVPVAKNDERTR